MHTTVVMNAKGGVGKTTISTNLASFFATDGRRTTILDCDPQGSSLRWLEERPPEAALIYAANGAPRRGRSFSRVSRHVPLDTEQLVIDAPAAPNRLLMQELLDRAHAILIPVAPSKIDIHATANFIKELLLITCHRHRGIRVGIVANRARASTAVYQPLERFVDSLKLSFVTHLFDSEVYIEVGDLSLGIFELDEERTAEQRREFMPIVEWVDDGVDRQRQAPSNVVPFVQGGALS